LRILFVGDVIGRPGRRALRALLPGIKESYGADFCIANGENAAAGKGITEKVAQEMFSCGVDVITSGNHIWDRKEGISYVQAESRLLRPANYPPGVGGIGYGTFQSRSGVPVGVINLQGRTFMPATDCPFRTALCILEEMDVPVKVVDFHAEATSEKVAMGWFLDGKVSAVVGTHTHVQTSDERVLSKGTAYITDVGMTGAMDSVIGFKKEVALRRFLTQLPMRYEPAEGDVWLCGVAVDVDEGTGRAVSIVRIREGPREGCIPNFGS